MSRAYYVCNVIGSGTTDDPYRPEIQDAAPYKSYRCVILTRDGKPISPWCLVVVAASDEAHRSLANHPAVDQLLSSGGLEAMPDVGWARNSLRARLAARGIDLTGLPAAGTNLNQVVRYLGQRLQPNFDESLFNPPSIVDE